MGGAENLGNLKGTKETNPSI